MTIRAGRTIFTAFSVALLAGCAGAQTASPQGLADSASGPALLVANKRGDSLSRVDLASGEETVRVDTCANPHELAVSPDQRHVAVVCYDGDGLEVYRTADLGRVKAIELGAGARPHGIVWHPSGMIVASAEGRGSIFTVAEPMTDAPQVAEIVSGESGGRDGPHMVVVDREGATAWGTVIPAATVVRYNLRAGAVAGRTVLSGETEAIALSPDDATVWVGANSADRIHALDAETLAEETSVTTGDTPIRIAMHPSGRWVVTSNLGDGSLSVIDTRSGELTRTIPVSGNAETAQVTLIFSRNGERLFAAETATNQVAEIDFGRGEVLRRLPAGEGGDGLAVVY